jgi:hypothetical protein
MSSGAFSLPVIARARVSTTTSAPAVLGLQPLEQRGQGLGVAVEEVDGGLHHQHRQALDAVVLLPGPEPRLTLSGLSAAT